MESLNQNIESQYCFQVVDQYFMCLEIDHNTLNSRISGQLNELELEENKSFFKNENILKARLSYLSPHFTFVPEAFFDEKLISDYLLFNTDVSFSERILHIHIPTIQAYMVYSVPYQVINSIQKIIPQTQVYPSFYPLLKAATNYNSLNNNDQFFIQIHSNRFEIIWFHLGKFTYYNQFEFQTPKELIYYTLSVCKQFNIQHSKVRLLLFGLSADDQAIQQALLDYFFDVELVNDSDLNFLLASVNHQLYPQLITTLQLSICE